MTTILTRRAALLAAVALAAACADALKAPIAIASGPATTSVGSVVEFSGAGSNDPNATAQPLAFKWAFTLIPPGSKAAFNDATLVNPSFTADVRGSYVAQLVVTAGQLASAPASVTVITSDCGDNAPGAAAPTFLPATPRLGQAVLLSTVADDPDNATACGGAQGLVYHWSLEALPAGSLATINLADARTPSFVADVEGDYTVAVTVTDDTGRTSAVARGTVTVSGCGGASPVVEAPVATPAEPGVGETVSLSAAATDADNDTACAAGQVLSYQWFFVALPTGSAAQLNDASVDSPSFAADLPGTYVVRARVSDGTGRSTLSAPLTVTVSECGSHPPVVDAVTASPAAPITGQVVQLTSTVTDADTAPGCARVESVRPAWRIVALPAGSHAALNDPGADNPSFTADRPGEYLVEVVARDGSGHDSAPGRLIVAVSACGDAAPEASIAAPTSVGTGATVTLTASAVDADSAEGCDLAEEISWAWSFDALPAGSRAALNATDVDAPSFVADVTGSYVVRLVATDAAGHAGAPVFATVEATACGTAVPVPVASASNAAPGVLQPVLLTATATDADNDAGCAAGQSFTWAWSFDSVPAGSRAAINQPAAREPSFVPDLPGAYVVRLRAIDPTGRTGTAEALTVTATSCGTGVPVPVASVSSTAPGIGQGVLLTATATDADNDTGCELGQGFTWAWSFDSLPAGSRATINQPAAREPSFAPDLPGDYVVRLRATDPTGRTGVSAPVTVSASTCGTALPAVTITPSTTTPAVGQAVNLASQGSDPDNDAPCSAGQFLTWDWKFFGLPLGSRAQIFGADSAMPWFIPDLPGGYFIGLRLTDNTGRIRFRSVTITADACGSNAPTASVAVSPASSGVGVPVRLAATATDADNQAACQGRTAPNPLQSLSYAWTLLSAPAGSTAQVGPSGGRDVSFVPDRPGDYATRLVVTDSTGRSSGPVDTTVTVGTCGTNRPAVTAVTATPSSGVVGGAVALSASFDDADNGGTCQAVLGGLQALSYEWTLVSAPAGSGARVDRASTPTSAFTPDVAGAYDLRFRVTDSTGRWAESTVTVTASGCGAAAPTVAPALSASSVLRVGGLVLATSGGADADNAAPCSAGQSLSYRWSIVEAPAGSRATLANATVQDVSFVPDLAGSYVLAVQATDSVGRVGVAGRVTAVVTTCGGNVPVAVITGALSGLVNSFLQLDAVNSTDADNTACTLGQTLTYRWELLAAPLGSTATINNTGLRNPSLRLDVVGAFVVRLTVTDSTGRSSVPVTHTVTANP